MKEAALFTDIIKNMKVKEEAMSDKDKHEPMFVMNEGDFEQPNSDQGNRRDSSIKKKHNTQVLPTKLNSRLDLRQQENEKDIKMPEVYLTEESPDLVENEKDMEGGESVVQVNFSSQEK